MTKEIYKYLKIPYEVSECKNICSTAKLLYGRLLLLEYKHGYIHASNNYLATIFNMSERSITRLLSSLSENNFITIVGKDNFHRKIYLKTKNGYYKFFKNLLNYGTKWHNFNFAPIYNKMEKFNDPNALPKEMDFYTFEEFQKFMSVIDDIKFKALFEILYFCGLRRGELRGLSWDNINFEDKTLSIVKNVTNMCGNHGYWQITTPKTRTNTRTLPMPDILVNDLKKLKEYNMKHQYQFTQKYFVFGDINPIHPDVLRRHKNEYAKKAEVKEIRIHDFRHSCASLLINNGANIMIVAKYLGHAKIDETLNTYSHLFKNKMDDIVNLMNKLDI